MDIREKTLAGLVAIFVLVTVALLLLSQTIFLDSYRTIESKDVTADVNVILSNIHHEFANLEASVSDWGPWDDLYSFAQGNNPTFVQDNLAKNTYDNLHLNFIAVINTSGTIVYGQSYNLTDGSFSQLPAELVQKITTDPAFLHQANASPISGFVVFPDSTALVASYPILHSDLSGPPAGILIMGRYLTGEEVRSLGIPSRSPPTFSPITLPSGHSVPGISVPVVQVSALSGEIIEGKTTLWDIDDNDALLLSLQEPRDYYRLGEQTIQFFLVVQLVIMLMLGIYIVYRIDWSILARLDRIVADTRAVSEGKALRIRKTGNDEIAQLAEAMNQMLGRIEQSHIDHRDSEEKFRSFVQESTDGYVLLDSRGQVIEWNAANERITGITRNEALGTPAIEIQIRLLVPERRIPQVIEHIRQLSASIFSTGEFSGFYKPMEAEILRPDGTRRTLQQIVFPIRTSTEQLFGLITRDITEHRMAEEALRQSHRKMNMLNTITFQDIRNATFALAGYHQLAGTVITHAEGREFLAKEDIILKKIDHSLTIAKNYQDLGINPPRWQDVNQAFIFALSHVDLQGVERTVRLDGLEIFADPLLEKVFSSLLENSLRHGEDVTAISLSYRRMEIGLELIFEDNGRGIPAEKKEKIFERGYGAGLGLFLVREILSITGMTIGETGIEGQGARFTIRVPEGMYRFGSDRSISSGS